MLLKCTKCLIEKDENEFYRAKERPNGRYSRCKKCKSDSSNKWRARNLDRAAATMRAYWKKYRNRRRDADYKKKYKIGLSEFESILASQNNACAICKKPAEAFKTIMNLDHNHKTNQVRGILCNRCNQALHFYEGFQHFEAAIEYLKRFESDLVHAKLT